MTRSDLVLIARALTASGAVDVCAVLDILEREATSGGYTANDLRILRDQFCTI